MKKLFSVLAIASIVAFGLSSCGGNTPTPTPPGPNPGPVDTKFSVKLLPTGVADVSIKANKTEEELKSVAPNTEITFSVEPSALGKAKKQVEKWTQKTGDQTTDIPESAGKNSITMVITKSVEIGIVLKDTKTITPPSEEVDKALLLLERMTEFNVAGDLTTLQFVDQHFPIAENAHYRLSKLLNQFKENNEVTIGGETYVVPTVNDWLYIAPKNQGGESMINFSSGSEDTGEAVTCTEELVMPGESAASAFESAFLTHSEEVGENIPAVTYAIRFKGGDNKYLSAWRYKLINAKDGNISLEICEVYLGPNNVDKYTIEQIAAEPTFFDKPHSKRVLPAWGNKRGDSELLRDTDAGHYVTYDKITIEGGGKNEAEFIFKKSAGANVQALVVSAHKNSLRLFKK